MAEPSLVALQGRWDHLSCLSPCPDSSPPGAAGHTAFFLPPAALREAAFSSYNSPLVRAANPEHQPQSGARRGDLSAERGASAASPLPAPPGAGLPGGMCSQEASLQLQVRLLLSRWPSEPFLPQAANKTQHPREVNQFHPRHTPSFPRCSPSHRLGHPHNLTFPTRGGGWERALETFQQILPGLWLGLSIPLGVSMQMHRPAGAPAPHGAPSPGDSPHRTSPLYREVL